MLHYESSCFCKHALLTVDSRNFLYFAGGAERLIVDAAMELASIGHSVHIFTSHHDKNRCFEETVSGEDIHYFFWSYLKHFSNVQ